MKKCKGTGKAKDYGCGSLVDDRQYGLCFSCFKSWLFTTAAGELEIKRRSIKASKENWNKRKLKIKNDLETVQSLVKKVQAEFNTMIRNRDSGKECISCNNILKGKFDAGHYFNANNHWAVRFDSRNVHGQCVACNQHKHGNLIEYRKKLLERIGEDGLEALESKAHETVKFTREELREKLELYRRLNNIIN